MTTVGFEATSTSLTCGLVDSRMRLVSADQALSELQEACGGRVPGQLAIPELRILVDLAQDLKLRIARKFSAHDGQHFVAGFVRIRPLTDGGFELSIEDLRNEPGVSSSHETATRLDTIDRVAAEIVAKLDGNQRIRMLNTNAADAKDFQTMVAADPGKPWYDFVILHGVSHQQPLHWRLLDGAECEIPGSARNWRIRLIPLGTVMPKPSAFELLFVSDVPFTMVDSAPSGPPSSHAIGETLTPVLRQPIARIVANAETIRARLAGPLRREYSDYAANIAAAGKHLRAMLVDLSDLESVENDDFSTMSEQVDLIDASRRAAGILGVRASDREITLDVDGEGDVVALAEYRRVLQILINLIGNAIAYSPEGSTVTIRANRDGEHSVSISVSDEGPGIAEGHSTKIFEKFERLGRESDGSKDPGSGLGLYISRKLALAMNGELTLQSPVRTDPPMGARFTLRLPTFQ